MQLICCAGYLGLLWLVGWAAVGAVLGRGGHPAERAGLALAGGHGLMGLILFVFSLDGWAPSRVMLLAIGLVAVAAIVAQRRRRAAGGLPVSLAPVTRASPVDNVLGALAAVLIVAAAANVGMQTLGVRGLNDIDVFAIWLFKAKILIAAPLRPIPGAMTAASLSYSHQDYPLGMPLTAAGIYAAVGGIVPRAANALQLPMYLALVGVLYGALRRELTRGAAAAVTAIFVASPVVVQHASLATAELPLVLMHACCVVLLLDWMRGGDRRILLASAGFAAFAAFTKNEGLALLPMIGVVMGAAALWRRERRRVGDVVLAAAVAATLLGPWLVYRRFLPHTHEDYGGKLVSLGTLATALPRLGATLPAFLSHLVWLNEAGLLWVVLAIAAMAGWRRWREPAVVVLWVLLVLHVGLYAVVFAVTPWDVKVLIPMVGPKLLMHAAPVGVLLIGLHLGGMRGWRAFDSVERGWRDGQAIR
jgi:hypothetical protein